MDGLNDFLAEWQSPEPTVLVHTSGSTGEPKPLLVEKRRMVASACATIKALGLKPGSTALLCMSLKYIAGKMMVVRSLVGNLRLISVEPSGHPLANVDESIDFAAMVPLQVYDSMKNPDELRRLKAVRHLVIGGGIIDKALETKLQKFPNAVWCTYGMTETLSHVALRRVNGSEASQWYTPLDGVSVSLTDVGCLVIDAPAVCPQKLVTHDCAELNPDGRRFRILGRIDNVIDSGGIKLHIEDIERKLRRLHELPPFLITKVPHCKFGEAVVFMMEWRRGTTQLPLMKNRIEGLLEKYEMPQYYMCVDKLPLTETGKIARKRAEEIACELQQGGCFYSMRNR